MITLLGIKITELMARVPIRNAVWLISTARPFLTVTLTHPMTERTPMARLRPSVVFLLLAMAIGSTTVAQDSIQYNRDIRPILNDACFACHGPDSASRKGELRLDVRDAALEKGAIDPGKPDNSEMIRRLLSDDPEEVMPPPELKKTLTPEQKKLLAKWIEDGAEYQQHWSYIAPHRPTVPEVPEAVRATLEAGRRMRSTRLS